MANRRAFLVNGLERYATMLINLMVLGIVSRILSPGEIGLHVIGAGLWLTLSAAREFVTPIYLIQRRELAPTDIGTSFTLLMIVSFAAVAVMVCAAPYLAAVFGDPRLALYLRLTAASFLLESVTVLGVALLQRHMRFDINAVINVAGSTIAALVTITLALSGAGYLSFAWAAVVSALQGVVLCLAWSPQLRTLRPSLQNWRAAASFGGYHGTSILLFRAFDAIPALMLARIISPEAAAFFNRANALAQMPEKIFLGTVSVISVPGLAAQVRAGAALGPVYVRQTGHIAAAQWPILLLTALLAEPMVRVLLGPRWLSIVPLIQILSIASLPTCLVTLAGPALMACGAIRDRFISNLIALPPCLVVLAMASFFGVYGVAICTLIIMPFQTAVQLHFLRRHIVFTGRDMARVLWPAAQVTLAAIIVPLCVMALNGGTSNLSLVATVVAGIGGVIGCTVGLAFTGNTFFLLARDLIIARVPGTYHRPAIKPAPTKEGVL